jgi:hypothetical protein
VRADAEPNTLGLDGDEISRSQILLAEMDIVGAQLQRLAPVVVDD